MATKNNAFPKIAKLLNVLLNSFFSQVDLTKLILFSSSSIFSFQTTRALFNYMFYGVIFVYQWV